MPILNLIFLSVFLLLSGPAQASTEDGRCAEILVLAPYRQARLERALAEVRVRLDFYRSQAGYREAIQVLGPLCANPAFFIDPKLYVQLTRMGLVDERGQALPLVCQALEQEAQELSGALEALLKKAIPPSLEGFKNRQLEDQFGNSW